METKKQKKQRSREENLNQKNRKIQNDSKKNSFHNQTKEKPLKKRNLQTNRNIFKFLDKFHLNKQLDF